MPIEDPLAGAWQGLVQGAFQGAQVRHLMLQTQLQQQAARRLEVRQQHEDAIRDEEFRQQNEDRDAKLTREHQIAGRQVEGGTIAEKMLYDVPNVATGGVDKNTATYRRPVDKSRLFRSKRSDGTVLETELYSEKEQKQRAIDQQMEVLKSEALQKAELGRQATERMRNNGELLRVENPNDPQHPFYVEPKDFHGTAEGLKTQQEMLHPAPPEDGIQGVNYETDDQGNVSAITTRKSGKRAVEPLGKLGKSKSTPTTNINMPREQFKDESAFRKEFGDVPLVKQRNEIQTQNARAREAYQQSLKAAKDGTSANASDQALVTVLNKMLDPTSVVREGEYARTAEGQSALSRLEGFADKVKRGGGGFSSGERLSIMSTVNGIATAIEKQYKPVERKYRGLAKSYGFDEERALAAMDEAPAAAAASGAKPTTAEEYLKGLGE